MNADAYESSSPEMKEIITQAAVQTELSQWNRIRGRLDDNYARMRSNGVTINTVPNIQLKFQLTQAALPVIADWKKNVASDVSLLFEQVKD